MNLSITTMPVFAEVLAAQAGAGLTWRDRSRQRGRSPSLRREAVEAEPVDRASDFSAQWRGLLLQQLVRQAGVVAFHGAMAKGFAVLADGMPIAAARQDQRRSLDAGIEVFRQIADEIDRLNRALAACGPGAAPALLDRRHVLLLEAGHWVGGDLVLNPLGQAGLSVDGQALMGDAGSLEPAQLASRFVRRDASGQPVTVLRGELGAMLALAHWAPATATATATATSASSRSAEAGLQAKDCWRGLATEHRLAHDIAVAVQSCLEDDWRSSAGVQLDQGTAQLWPFQRAYAGATSLLADGSLLIGGLLQVIDQTTARGRAPVPAAA
jgi:hypothetical protein